MRNLVILRRLSTTLPRLKPTLSSNYTSLELWNQRFNCKYLHVDEAAIKSINLKISTGAYLDNLELDYFVNISSGKSEDIDQLKEVLRLLKHLRRSIYAHTVLPSTNHAICRYFIYSQKLPSLINVLEDRVNYGIIPDFFIMNLLFNECLSHDDYANASRLAALVMLQEEFGVNRITDLLAAYSITRYIESKTDFKDWASLPASLDPVLQAAVLDQIEKKPENTETNARDDDDEDEDEYIRVPFLRNPYFDNHFDLNIPRDICGKTLVDLGRYFTNQGDEEVAIRCSLLGTILLGQLSQATKLLENVVRLEFKLGQLKEVIKHYLENTSESQDVNKSDEKVALLEMLNNVIDGEGSLSDDIESIYKRLPESFEVKDIEQFKIDLNDWCNERSRHKNLKENFVQRENLIAEIRAKKEELRLKEQYLYFFDNMKKSNLTRIEYN